MIPISNKVKLCGIWKLIQWASTLYFKKLPKSDFYEVKNELLIEVWNYGRNSLIGVSFGSRLNGVSEIMNIIAWLESRLEAAQTEYFKVSRFQLTRCLVASAITTRSNESLQHLKLRVLESAHGQTTSGGHQRENYETQANLVRKLCFLSFHEPKLEALVLCCERTLPPFLSLNKS